MVRSVHWILFFNNIRLKVLWKSVSLPYFSRPSPYFSPICSGFWPQFSNWGHFRSPGCIGLVWVIDYEKVCQPIVSCYSTDYFEWIAARIECLRSLTFGQVPLDVACWIKHANETGCLCLGSKIVPCTKEREGPDGTDKRMKGNAF